MAPVGIGQAPLDSQVGELLVGLHDAHGIVLLKTSETLWVDTCRNYLPIDWVGDHPNIHPVLSSETVQHPVFDLFYLFC